MAKLLTVGCSDTASVLVAERTIEASDDLDATYQYLKTTQYIAQNRKTSGPHPNDLAVTVESAQFNFAPVFTDAGKTYFRANHTTVGWGNPQISGCSTSRNFSSIDIAAGQVIKVIRIVEAGPPRLVIPQ